MRAIIVSRLASHLMSITLCTMRTFKAVSCLSNPCIANWLWERRPLSNVPAECLSQVIRSVDYLKEVLGERELMLPSYFQEDPNP